MDKFSSILWILCALFWKETAASSNCSISNIFGSRVRAAETQDEYKFLVDIECQPDNMRISWQLTPDTSLSYVASILYSCVGENGSTVSHTHVP